VTWKVKVSTGIRGISAKQFLRCNKLISENVRQAYLNFTQLLKKIMRIPQQQLPTILPEVEIMEVLAGKEWFLEVLNGRAKVISL